MSILFFISVKTAQNLIYNVKLSLFILLRVFNLRDYHCDCRSSAGNIGFFFWCFVVLFRDLSLGTPDVGTPEVAMYQIRILCGDRTRKEPSGSHFSPVPKLRTKAQPAPKSKWAIFILFAVALTRATTALPRWAQRGCSKLSDSGTSKACWHSSGFRLL